MKTLAVAKRLIKQIGGDKRSIGLMFIEPVFIMFLLNVVFTSSTSKPTIDVVSAPEAFIKILEKNAYIIKVNNEQTALDDLKQNKADAYVTFSNNTPVVTVEGTNPSVTKLVLGVFQKSTFENMMNTLKPFLMRFNQNITSINQPEIRYFYGSEELEFFDSFAPLLMGFFIFFFVFLIAGISFLRERISGTLERMLATPVGRRHIVFGYFLGFGLFVAIQTIIIQTFIIYGLDVIIRGNFWLVLLLNLLIATTALSLGTFLSAYARNEFQLFQFIPLVIVPQILFSGIFDLKEAPQWVNILSQMLPLTYAAEALRDVMIRGLGIENVLKEIFVLLGFAIFFLILNILALKKYRKI